MYIGRCQTRIWCWSNCKPSCRCVRSIVMLWRLELLLAYGSNSRGVSDAGIIGKLVFWLWVTCCLLLPLIIISTSVVPIIHTAESNAYTHGVESSTGTNIQPGGVPNNAEETHSCSCYWCHQCSMTKLPGHKHNNTSTMTTTTPSTYKHVWAYKLNMCL